MEHGTAGGSGWLAALQNSALGATLRESLWLYPAVEVAHILGFALLVGAVVAFDLRLLGLRGLGLPAVGLARLLLPVSIAGFLLAMASGALLFVTEATGYARNPVFLVKLALVALALLNILAFHRGIGRRIAGWDLDDAPPPAARLAGLASLLLWIGVLAAGRLIAYL